MSTIGTSLKSETNEVQITQCPSSAFNAAVAGSWFIRTMGIASVFCAVIYGILGGHLGMALLIGLGIYIMRSREMSIQKPLGILVILGACLSVSFPLLAFVTCVGLSGTILAQGTNILRTLSREGRNNSQWAAGHKRAMVGVLVAALSFVVWLAVFVFGVILYSPAPS